MSGAAYSAGFQNAPEVRDPIALRVTGTLPPWMSGALIRNGPGTFDIPISDGKRKGTTYSFKHMFDALGLVHKLDIDGAGGKVTYLSHKLNRGTEAYIGEHGVMPPNGGTFAEPPATGLVGRALAGVTGKLFGKGDKAEVEDALGTAQTNAITSVQGKLVATGGEFVELDPATLQPLSRFTHKDISSAFKGELACGLLVRDQARKETISFALQFGTSATWRVLAIPDGEEPYIVHEYSHEEFAEIHSFAVTEHYVIMAHWPSTIKPLKLVASARLMEALAWEPANGVRFRVFDRKRGGRGLVATFSAEAFYAFHHANAFEQPNGSICLDIATYPDIAVLKTFELENLRSGARPYDKPTLKRYTLTKVEEAGPGSERPAQVKTLVNASALHLELPRFDHRRRNLPYTVLYTLSMQAGQPWFTGISKASLASGAVEATWAPAGVFPCEPIFVPRPGGTAEDDGVLLSVVLSGSDQKSFFVVLNAKDLSEVARAALPVAVPFGFHGNFYSRDLAFTTET